MSTDAPKVATGYRNTVYQPQRTHEKIHHTTDVFDIAYAWGIDEPKRFSCLKYVLRAGRKIDPGFTVEQAEAKDLRKLIVCATRRLEELEKPE